MHSTVNLQRLIPPTAEAGSSNSTVPTMSRNPYASTAKRGLSQITPSTSATTRTTSTAAAPAGDPRNSHRRDDLMSIVLGRGIQTNNKTSEDETTMSGAHRWRHDRRFGCSVQVDETEATPSNNNNNNNNNNDSSATNLEALLEDSDDDIDELLSFSAFSKRRS